VSRRTERVASIVRSVLAEAIQARLNDPRIEPLTSITRVDVSADMSAARVYVSVMASDSRRKLTLQALRCAAGRLRSLVAERVVLRQVPQINFHLDDSVQVSFETIQEIDRLMQDLGESPGLREESETKSDDAGLGGRDGEGGAPPGE
jgi:ribosome-binding factor A